MLGVLAFIVALLFLVLVHEWGHFFAARRLGVKVEEFGFGFPPRIAKKHWRGTDYTFNWLPFGGFVRLKGEEGESDAADSYASQSAWKRLVIVLAGVVMNLVAAVVLLTVVLSVGVTRDVTEGVDVRALVSETKHYVAGVLADAPASGKLQPGDVIANIDGQTFVQLSELQQYVRESSGGIVVTVERAGELVTTELQPAQFDVNGTEVYGIGTQLQSLATVSYPWYWAPVEAVRVTGETFALIATTLGGMVVGLVQGQTDAVVEVTGPIGIAVLTGDVVTFGIVAFLQFVALLSINLAFLNVLPIPALDGGRMAFIMYEIVVRRAISERAEATLHRVGFSLLLLLIVAVTIADIGRFSGTIVSAIKTLLF